MAAATSITKERLFTWINDLYALWYFIRLTWERQMFNTQILLSWMGFIWSLLKPRGFCLICENVRLKSQEEVSVTINSEFFSVELFSGGSSSCCIHGGERGCAVRAARGSWQPLCLGLAPGFPWLLQTTKHTCNQRLQLDLSSFFLTLNLPFGRGFPQPISFGRWFASVKQLPYCRWTKRLTEKCTYLMFRFSFQALKWVFFYEPCLHVVIRFLASFHQYLYFILSFWQQ